MQKITTLAFFFLVSFLSFSQCPSSTINVRTQAQLNNFFAQFPNCTNLTVGMNVGHPNGSNITDLSGFSQILSTTEFISILGTQITSLNGLQGVQFLPGSSIGLRENSQLNNLEHAGSLQSNDFSLFLFSQTIPDFQGFPPHANLRLISVSNSQISDLNGLQNVVTLSQGIILSSNPNLVSLNGLNASLTGLNGLTLFRIGNNPSLQQLGTIAVAPNVKVQVLVSDNPLLPDLLGLEAITLAENITIENNAILSSLNGLDNVQAAEDLKILNNNMLPDFSGLGSLSSLDLLEVKENQNLFSFNGLQNVQFTANSFFTSLDIENNPNLTSIAGLSAGNFTARGIAIENNPLLLNLDGLEGFAGVTRSVDIRDNSSINNLDGLVNLNNIQQNLFLVNNDALQNINGLVNLTALGEDCFVSNNEVLSNVDGLSGLTAAGSTGFIDYWFVNNPLLNNITGIESIDFTVMAATSELKLENNPNLAVCDVQSVCDLIANNGPAQITINQNAPGCNSEFEVVLACGLDVNIISGEVKFDFNVDGCDPADVVAPNLLIETTQGANTFSTFTNSSGAYQTFIDVDGTVSTSVNPASLPEFFQATPASQDSNFVGFGNEDIIDFCLTATETINDLKISLIPLFDPRPGFDSDYKIVYENLGTTQLSGQVTLQIDEARQTFVSATPNESTVNAGLITWDFIDLNPFESRVINITLNNFAPPTNEIDDQVLLEAKILPDDQDASPEDNFTNIIQTYVGAYDPNDKVVLQGDEIAEERVGGYLEYRIRFQNQGTADAINVVIEDVLDPNLQWGTLRPLIASHPYRVEIRNGNEVSFIFENINLPPESTDPVGSQGYVVFKIKTEDTLIVGDTVENTASIFFDFNPPIITNTALTTVVDLAPPTAICQSITVALDQNGQATITPTDIDNGSFDNNGISNLELDITDFDCSNLGENTVNLTVTDTYGNQSSCSAIVTVIDDLGPTIACVPITVELNENGTATIDPLQLVDLANTTDNCELVSIGATIGQVSCEDIGAAVQVTVIAEDSSGNFSTCETTIEVLDTSAPDFDQTTLPQDTVRQTDAGGVYVLEDFTSEVITTDNCSQVSLSQIPAVGTELSPGVYDITITAEDDFANAIDYTFELTVEEVLGSEEFLQQQIRIYPNPVSDLLRIELASILKLEKITIYSILGETVLITSEAIIDVTNLSDGMYFVLIETDKGTAVKQIVKN